MRRPIRFTLVLCTSYRCVAAGAVLAAVIVGAGCGGPGEPGDDQTTNSTVEENYATAEMAATKLDAALAAGTEPVTALQALAADFNSDSGVRVTVTSQDGRSVWVVFKSGLECIYDVLEWPSGFTTDLGLMPSATEEVKSYDATLATSAAKALWSDNETGALTRKIVMPAAMMTAIPEGSKALVANSLLSCVPKSEQSDYDMRYAVCTFLRRLGYDVYSSDARVEMFEALTEGKFGVIFIEATGSKQSASEMIAALAGQPIPSAPYTSIEGNSEVLQTSTKVTNEYRVKYSQDLKYGRLKIRFPWYRDDDGKETKCGAFFGVTPNFIRAHDSGTFLDNTLVCLRSENAISETLESEWFNVLKEKGKGGWMVGWMGAPSHPTSVVGYANLFELMTGGEMRYKQKVYPANTVIESDAAVPPLTHQSLGQAMNALGAAGETIDSETLASFLFLWNDEENQMPDLILAPKIRDFYLDRLGQAGLVACAPDHATSRIGDTHSPAGLADVDIGSYGVVDLAGGFLVGAGWTFRVPVALAGPVTLRLADDRHSRPLDLLTWKPTFSIAGTGPKNLSYTISYVMTARALAAPRERVGTVEIDSPWTQPNEDTFKAQFDGGDSTVAWTVGGSATIGQFKYVYSGGGAKTLSFTSTDEVPTDADLLRTGNDASTVDIAITAEVQMTYTETVTNLEDGTETVYQRAIPTTGLYLPNTPLGSGLTVQGGSQTRTPSQGYTETVTWSAFSPTPAFNTNTFRR